jgi:hydroxyethylthiazole kinase-like uncharacterized protein yjeF
MTAALKLTAAGIKKILPRRPADTHKGKNGHVLIVAGSRGMSGAAVLCARGALRIGAGLVTVATVASERSVVTHQIPEAMTLALPESDEGAITEEAGGVLADYARKRKINTLAAGPGLTKTFAVTDVIMRLIGDWPQKLVLDADALNSVAADDLVHPAGLVITPHAGELAGLLEISTETVLADRQKLAEKNARDFELCCVLKGHQTLITTGEATRINSTGNPAMATGGMGDVLTGAIAGLLAQGLDPWSAACAGVYLHGLAGDLAKVSDRGLLAGDLAEALPRALAKIGVR